MRADQGTVDVLERDADLSALGGGLLPRRVNGAGRARLISAQRGRWTPGPEAKRAAGGLGLLVVEGVILRRMLVAGRSSAELLAPGDLINPAFETDSGELIARTASWRVLQPTSLALLDAGWSARMAAFPEVLASLSARGVRRARRLTAMLAIDQDPQLERRLLLLLWELAERFGTVGPDGVRIELPLTHEDLSQLASARRPSVSAALTRLRDDGMIVRRDRGWLLRHESAPAGR
jgi:CRP/FNR family transcriptional regulator, cyclic AMP receptor protein